MIICFLLLTPSQHNLKRCSAQPKMHRYCSVVKIIINCCDDDADGGHLVVTGITARASEAVKCNEMQ